MMNKKYLTLITFMLLTISVFSQRGNMEKGDEYYNKRMYREAIDSYKLALEEKIVFEKYEMTKRVAQTYKMLFDYENASIWYAKLTQFADKNEPSFIFDYAQLLCNLEKYEEAKSQFKKYFDAVGSPDKYALYEKNCNWAIENLNNKKKVNVYKTNIETGSRSLGLSYYKDGIVSAQPQGSEFNEKTVFYDLAYSKKTDTALFENPVLLKGGTNHSFYEGAPSFSSDGKTLYYTGNATEVVKYREKQAKRKKLPISKDGVNILYIYEAKLENGVWKEGKAMSFNSKEYDCAFAHFNTKGDRLYFASNMPGGNGGFDLYYCVKENDTTWSAPVNLGDLNSELDEMYPYTDNDTLYYSSKGKEGFGGSDIYKSYINGQDYEAPINMGKPYNSSKDDFSFIIKNDDRQGYFSSNREGLNGYDYIYEFYIPEGPDTINGTALNKITMKPIKDIEVKLHKVDSNGVPVLDREFLTDDLGRVQLILEKHVEFLVTFYHPGFDAQTFEIPGENREDVVAKFGQILFVPIPKKNTVIKIDNIYFDYNKSSIKEESFDILNTIADYLKTNSTIKVEMSAHTDSRGGDAYNLKLSQRRAQSVVNHLTKLGVKKSRMVPKGYGEKKLVNECSNGVKCSEEDHQKNRRVELKVL